MLTSHFRLLNIINPYFVSILVTSSTQKIVKMDASQSLTQSCQNISTQCYTNSFNSILTPAMKQFSSNQQGVSLIAMQMAQQQQRPQGISTSGNSFLYIDRTNNNLNG